MDALVENLASPLKVWEDMFLSFLSSEVSVQPGMPKMVPWVGSSSGVTDFLRKNVNVLERVLAWVLEWNFKWVLVP